MICGGKMSNEFREWLFDRFSDVLIENNEIDHVLQTIVLSDTPWDWHAVVHGTKDGIHVKYNVWFDNEEEWQYERSEE